MEDEKVGFKPGEVIQGWTKPFVKVLSPSEKGRRCANCFKPSRALSRCGACRINYYCSEKCQREDWKFAHSVECKMTLFLKPVLSLGILPTDPKMSAIVARILAHLKRHPEAEFEKYGLYDGTKRSFNDLEAHVNDGDPAMDNLAEKMSALTIKDDSKWNTQLVRKILGIWKTNAFMLLDETEEGEIGGGLYVQSSVFNHSCRPNALRVCNSDQCMEIRCLGEIPQGRQAYITYLAGMRNRVERQMVLKQRYNFDCKCDLCEEEKAGPVTNYDLLKKIKESIEYGLAMSKGHTFEEIVQLRDKVLELYRPLFHPYDERVTNFTTCVFNRVAEYFIEMRMGKIEKADSIQKLADDTLRRLEITFGKGYYEYQNVKADMIRLQIEVPE